MDDSSAIRKKWDHRHSQPPSMPDPFLVDTLRHLRPGSAIELACGTGRNSLFLAEKKISVTAVDISPVGLRYLRETAERRGLQLITIEADLEEAHSSWGIFDNLIMIHYMPSRRLLRSAHTFVKPGGTFLFCTFNTKSAEMTNPAYALEPGALVQGVPGFRLVDYREDARCRDGYVFQRE